MSSYRSDWESWRPGWRFAAVLATVSVVHGELLGEVSAELRAKLAGSDVPVVFTPYKSM